MSNSSRWFAVEVTRLNVPCFIVAACPSLQRRSNIDYVNSKSTRKSSKALLPSLLTRRTTSRIVMRRQRNDLHSSRSPQSRGSKSTAIAEPSSKKVSRMIGPFVE
mmetsp:Transcript_18158/g.22877  ORF Transcript_18158/g.22877 Transcript_18158/m.22877 type:complete len:105 (+) Transcript_18158:649-963(+)